MKLGAEPQKVAAVAVLLPVAAYLMYSNVLAPSGNPNVPAERPITPPPALNIPQRSAAANAAGEVAAARGVSALNSRTRRTGSQEWTPVLKARRPEDRPDPNKVDPTLRLELLSRLGNVPSMGGERSLFEFGQAPPPPPPVADVKIPLKPGSKPGEVAEVKPEEPAGPPPEPPKPPPPPIPLKFYGFVQGSLGKRAFFLKGEDIFVAEEGALIEKRYKVVRIANTFAEVEDTQHENHRQQLRLEEPRA